MSEQNRELIEYAEVIKLALEKIVKDPTMAEDDKVIVMYATPQIAFAKYKEEIKNGSKSGPLVTFYLSACEIRTDCQMGGYHSLTLYRDEEDYLIRAPVICRLKYTVTINCIKEEQADILQTQVLLSTPMNRPYWSKINGQFVTVYSEDVQNLSSVDVGDQKDKFSRRQITLVIDRAYLQHPYKALNKQSQKEICISLNSEEILNGKIN